MDALELVLDNPERKSLKARLLDLPPMGVGVEVAAGNRARAFLVICEVTWAMIS
jgi:hypothetical protein